MELIGRKAERLIIREVLTSGSPELVAVWGRRRVGKTFLVRKGRAPAEDHFFEVTGRRKARRKEQIGHFMDGFVKAFHPSYTLPLPENWDGAFRYLGDAIESSFPGDDKPITVFFDEAPWLDSRGSGFIDALEYFWNSKGSKYSRLKVFICGSAASWIVQKILRGKGGWHRRITHQIRVEPFKLHESETFLHVKDIRLSRADLLKLYMVMGGVPYYLNLMSRGESVSGAVDRLFFSDPPELKGEFDELFDSLFDNSPVHKRIISAVAGTKAGLTRSEIASRAKLPSGGNLSRYIDNLEQSGFLEAHEPLGRHSKKDMRYRVCDMFTLFHRDWLAGKLHMRSWQSIVTSQRYKSWCGHAFEIVAWNHARYIADALGLSKNDYYVTRATLQNKEGRAQIDLLLDVTGGAVYLMELKCSDDPFVMSANEAGRLLQSRRVLSEHFKGKRSIIVCLLAAGGAQANAHLREAVDLTLDVNALFPTAE
ncbi:MAG TPA: hypothetical protein VF745_05295 [Steroidobacteraceae bacterium]